MSGPINSTCPSYGPLKNAPQFPLVRRTRVASLSTRLSMYILNSHLSIQPNNNTAPLQEAPSFTNSLTIMGSNIGGGGVDHKEEKKHLLLNEDWRQLQATLLGIFQRASTKPQLFSLIETSNALVANLEQQYGTIKLLKSYLVVVCKGMIILRQDMKDQEDDAQVFKTLADTWTTFYTIILPLILSIFCISNGKLYPNIRSISLLAFRDHVILCKTIRSRLEATLKKVAENEVIISTGGKPTSVCMVSSRITQMLLVALSCNRQDEHERVIQKLLSAFEPSMPFPQVQVGKGDDSTVDQEAGNVIEGDNLCICRNLLSDHSSLLSVLKVEIAQPQAPQ